MDEISGRPDISRLEIPTDIWTQPFWDAAREQQLKLPRCGACGTFRWPPGPFCPECRSQLVDWADAGEGRVFSFTIIRAKAREGVAVPPALTPALIEFPKAGGVRMMAAVVDSLVASIAIGAQVEPVWVEAANATVPMFRLA